PPVEVVGRPRRPDTTPEEEGWLMAYVRRLPSGLWQATVRHPSGRRITNTDPLKRVVAEWARDLESQFARGDLRDPRAGRITVAEWFTRREAVRGVDANTRDKTES